MDTKITIKEEDPFSATHTESEFFTKNVTLNTNNDAVLLDNDGDVAVKPEIKSETFSHFCSQEKRECSTNHFANQIKFETIICSNKYEVQPKIEIDSEKKREFLTEDPVMKVNDHEMEYKVKIKDEPCWLEVQSSSFCNDIKEGDFTTVKSPRLCTEVVLDDSSSDSPWLPTATSGKGTSFLSGKNYLESGSHKSNVTKIPSIQKHANSDQFSERSTRDEAYSRALWIHKDGSSKCNLGENCTTESALKLHSFIHESRKPQKCKICEKNFTVLGDLKRHNLIHEGKKPHKCEICGKSFTHLSDLKRHNLIHEGKKPHKCEICGRSFTHLSALKRHNLIHEGTKPHKCEICGRSFTHLSALKAHNLVHEGKKTHKCKICDKSFTLLGDLKRHNLIHEGKKPHSCDVCGKSFTHLSTFKSHIFIHEGKQPHKCEICKKGFTHLGDLKRHVLIHEGKKPHKCEICGKTFTLLGNLKKHNVKHETKEPYKCELCEKRFTLLDSLKKHYMVHEAKKPHKCEFCEKGFTLLSHLKLHNLIHKDKVAQMSSL